MLFKEVNTCNPATITGTLSRISLDGDEDPKLNTTSEGGLGFSSLPGNIPPSSILVQVPKMTPNVVAGLSELGEPPAQPLGMEAPGPVYLCTESSLRPLEYGWVRAPEPPRESDYMMLPRRTSSLKPFPREEATLAPSAEEGMPSGTGRPVAEGDAYPGFVAMDHVNVNLSQPYATMKAPYGLQFKQHPTVRQILASELSERSRTMPRTVPGSAMKVGSLEVSGGLGLEACARGQGNGVRQACRNMRACARLHEVPPCSVPCVPPFAQGLLDPSSSAGHPVSLSGHLVSPVGLCPLQVAQPEAGMSFTPTAAPAPCCILDLQRPFPFLLHLLPLLWSLPVPCQRKRLRYSDLDFEVSLATAAGITTAHHGVGCHLVTEPPCPQLPVSTAVTELGLNPQHQAGAGSAAHPHTLFPQGVPWEGRGRKGGRGWGVCQGVQSHTGCQTATGSALIPQKVMHTRKRHSELYHELNQKFHTLDRYRAPAAGSSKVRS